MRFRCYRNSRGAGVMIYSSGWPDFDDMYFMQRYLRPGDAFVDVGANIGIYTLLAASLVGEGGRVLAFEPGRIAFERLEENIQINGLVQVETHFAAVSDRPGTIRFLQQQDLTNRIALPEDEKGPEDRLNEVPCVTLDTSLGGTSFAMGKIDVEGAESLALRGAEQSLRKSNPPVWLIEFKDPFLRRFGSSASDLKQFLREAGYELGFYDATKRKLVMSATAIGERENLLAVHRSAVDAVNTRLAEREAVAT